ncbi:hypothetical protein RhiJN_21285 [Ceratobasidium sp. AG-Ba]|nr:hypothetical protein RhiJN_21285 [Ceratobasidium sp. AG-Ba]
MNHCSHVATEAKKSPNVITPEYATAMSQVALAIAAVNSAMAAAWNNHNLYLLSPDGKTQITAQDLVTRFDDLFKIQWLACWDSFHRTGFSPPDYSSDDGNSE